MWDSEGYGTEQGGFFNSPTQFSTPAEKQGKVARRVQNIVPVTIRQILESREDGLKIGNMDVNMFTLVALIRRVEVTSTKVTYLLDDCTGGITGIFFLESADLNLHTNNSNTLSNSFMATSASTQPAGFSPQQNLVYSTISNCSRDIGAHKDEVIKALAGKMSEREVMTVVDFLSNEGHIYTTIDDDHFRCTDN